MSNLFFFKANRTLIRVSGDDRFRVINNFFTNELRELEAGQGVEGFFPNTKGKINGHAFVFIQDDAIWIEGSAAQEESIPKLINQYVITEDVEFENLSATHVAFILNSESDSSTPAMVNDFDGLGIGFESTLFPGSTIVHVHGDRADMAVQAWQNAPRKEFDAEEWNHWRITHGIPQMGIDFDDSNFPQELGRDDATISFTKGCYLGQETIARIDSLGHVNQHIVSVTVDTEKDLTLPSVIEFDGKIVGKLTSLSSVTEGTIRSGIATLRVPHHRPSTILKAEFGTITVN